MDAELSQGFRGGKWRREQRRCAVPVGAAISAYQSVFFSGQFAGDSREEVGFGRWCSPDASPTRPPQHDKGEKSTSGGTGGEFHCSSLLDTGAAALSLLIIHKGASYPNGTLYLDMGPTRSPAR